MTNAIPKIYDKENEQWIELMAKPIAKEVVRIMKEDFMYNKNEIKLLEIPYGNENEFIYYIAYQSNVSESAISNVEDTLPFILNEILNKKDEYYKLSSKEILNNPDAFIFIEPLNTFSVIYKDTFGNEISTKNNELPQGLLNIALRFIKNNISGNFTISYVFNDNAIEEKQYKYVKE